MVFISYGFSKQFVPRIFTKETSIYIQSNFITIVVSSCFTLWLIMNLIFILINLCLGYQISVSGASNFTQAWTNFTKDPQLTHATYSITILDNSTANIIFSYNKDVGLAPASNLKTVTGSAAFHYLGPEYRYETLLQYSGKINPFGILDGYIYIVGSGDPSLGSSRWNITQPERIIQRWISLLAITGIKQCSGIGLDLSIWPGLTQTIPNGYPWYDLGNGYGTGSSALNWCENQFRIYLAPGSTVGDPVSIVGFDHPPSSVTFIDELITSPAGSGDTITLYLPPDGTEAYLRGTLAIDSPQNFSFSGAIPNSAVYLANEFIQGMRWPSTTSIKILYRKDANASQRITLDTYQSPPLSELIYWFEQVSINMYGEVLIKTIAHVINATTDSILPVYCQNEHGIEQTAVATMDGSGLSPENRITTSAIAHVLYNVRKKAPWFPYFEQALPIYNGIKMKSGYIHNVLAYSGYVNKQVFSIIINNFNGMTSVMRQKIWNLLDTLK